ncbi:MAG: hypothetical protein KAR47_15985 [Planctomycetes bacterium]|nr:hypothetical protein [Planctomycetota bacterium]
MQTTKNLVIGFLIGIVIMLLVGASSIEETGRYELKFGDHSVLIQGVTGRGSVFTISSLFKVDTVTGKTWEFRDIMRENQKPEFVSSFVEITDD